MRKQLNYQLRLSMMLLVQAIQVSKSPAAFVRAWARFPIYYLGLRAVEDTPAIPVTEVVPDSGSTYAPLIGTLARTQYNVRLDEQIYIGYIIQTLGARRIFEIGTFDGDTTRYMAEASGSDGCVWTIDLPPEAFTEAGLQGWFMADDVGRAYRGTSQETQIVQLRGDSTAFDYTPYWGTMDLVFVDAAHDYSHGFIDSHTALRLARPGGYVVWHDFSPQWGRLVHAIRRATRGYDLRRIAGTSVAVVRKPA